MRTEAGCTGRTAAWPEGAAALDQPLLGLHVVHPAANEQDFRDDNLYCRVYEEDAASVG